MPPSDTSPRAAPMTPSRCSSTRGGWRLSENASCETTTRNSNSTEVGRPPLLYSILEMTRSYLPTYHNEKKKHPHACHQYPVVMKESKKDPVVCLMLLDIFPYITPSAVRQTYNILPCKVGPQVPLPSAIYILPANPLKNAAG